jgi:imidazole glycerol-phosphate synthase subunit HisH
MIGIINYGSGNIYAIATVFKKLDIHYKIIEQVSDFKGCNKLVLPGVGAFDETMHLLRIRQLYDTIDQLVKYEKLPIIGFCVGMQIMGENSEEGNEIGFGWIPGSIKKLDASKLNSKPLLPHLGWNTISSSEGNPLLKNVIAEKGFYFLHSYYFHAANASDILATVNYGLEFPCIVNRDNVYGVQFHPEKSHQNGIELFRNFANL